MHRCDRCPSWASLAVAHRQDVEDGPIRPRPHPGGSGPQLIHGQGMHARGHAIPPPARAGRATEGVLPPRTISAGQRGPTHGQPTRPPRPGPEHGNCRRDTPQAGSRARHPASGPALPAADREGARLGAARLSAPHRAADDDVEAPSSGQEASRLQARTLASRLERTPRPGCRLAALRRPRALAPRLERTPRPGITLAAPQVPPPGRAVLRPRPPAPCQSGTRSGHSSSAPSSSTR